MKTTTAEKSQLVFLKNLDQKGFSIASVVVAMGIFSVLAMGITSVVQHLMGQVVYLEDKQSAMTFRTELTMDLSDNQSCVNTLTGLTVERTPGSVATVTNIKDKTGRSLYSSRSYDRLRIASLSLENASINSTATSGKMYVVANLTREKGAELSPVKIPINVVLNGTNRVDSCSSSGDGKGCKLYFSRYYNRPSASPVNSVRSEDVPEGFSYQTTRQVCNDPFGCRGSEGASKDTVYDLNFCKNGEWKSVSNVGSM